MTDAAPELALNEAIERGIIEACWNTSRTSFDIEAFKATLAGHGYEVRRIEPHHPLAPWGRV